MFRIQSDRNFSICVSVIYLIVVSFALLNHEMWRDELQPFVQGRDAASLSDLLYTLNLDGHFLLWPLLLRGLSWIERGPWIMQALNLALAIIFVYLMTWRAPFPRCIRVMTCFSHYFVYEYSVKARPYLLGALLLLIACIFYRDRWQRPFRFVGILILAAFSSLHAMIVAIGFGAAFLWEFFSSQNKFKSKVTASLGAFVLGLGAAIYLGKPSPDSLSNVPLEFSFDANYFYIVVGLLSESFSITNPQGLLPMLVSIGIFLTWNIVIFKNRPAFIFFLVSTLGLLIVFYFLYFGLLRHHGFLFLTGLYSLWIFRESESRLNRSSDFIFFPLAIFLGFQIWSGIQAIEIDAKYPYSNGGAVADYLKQNKLDSLVLSVDPDFAGVTIAGYLDKPVYYPGPARMGTYHLWNRVQHSVDDFLVVKRTEAKALELNQDMILAVNRPLKFELVTSENLQFLKSFEGALESAENFWLYRVPGR